MSDISILVGKTLTEVRRVDNEEIHFVVSDSETYKMYHSQDCCECVEIEDIEGDLQGLVGTPILLAEGVSQEDPKASESGTWTFYKLATINGHIDIRWYGSSNGYYSEGVSFDRVDA